MEDGESVSSCFLPPDANGESPEVAIHEFFQGQLHAKYFLFSVLNNDLGVSIGGSVPKQLYNVVFETSANLANFSAGMIQDALLFWGDGPDDNLGLYAGMVKIHQAVFSVTNLLGPKPPADKLKQSHDPTWNPAEQLHCALAGKLPDGVPDPARQAIGGGRALSYVLPATWHNPNVPYAKYCTSKDQHIPPVNLFWNVIKLFFELNINNKPGQDKATLILAFSTLSFWTSWSWPGDPVANTDVSPLLHQLLAHSDKFDLFLVASPHKPQQFPMLAALRDKGAHVVVPTSKEHLKWMALRGHYLPHGVDDGDYQQVTTLLDDPVALATARSTAADAGFTSLLWHGSANMTQDSAQSYEQFLRLHNVPSEGKLILKWPFVIKTQTVAERYEGFHRWLMAQSGTLPTAAIMLQVHQQGDKKWYSTLKHYYVEENKSVVGFAAIFFMRDAYIEARALLKSGVSGNELLESMKFVPQPGQGVLYTSSPPSGGTWAAGVRGAAADWKLPEPAGDLSIRAVLPWPVPSWTSSSDCLAFFTGQSSAVHLYSLATGKVQELPTLNGAGALLTDAQIGAGAKELKDWFGPAQAIDAACLLADPLWQYLFFRDDHYFSYVPASTGPITITAASASGPTPIWKGIWGLKPPPMFWSGIDAAMWAFNSLWLFKGGFVCRLNYAATGAEAVVTSPLSGGRWWPKWPLVRK